MRSFRIEHLPFSGPPAGLEVAVANRRSRDRWDCAPAVPNRFKTGFRRLPHHEARVRSAPAQSRRTARPLVLGITRAGLRIKAVSRVFARDLIDKLFLEKLCT